MASRAFTSRLLAPLRATARPTSTAFRLARAYSTPASTPDSKPASTPSEPPPLLQKLKGDLKEAMRAKDKPRLAVLRSVLAKVLNASKTDKPIQTDYQLVSLLRKSQRSLLDAAKEFKAANRNDLVEKEEEQAAIIQEYVAGSGVPVLPEEELQALVKAAFEEAKSAGTPAKAVIGEVMSKVVIPRQKKMNGDWHKVPKMVMALQK